MKNLTPDLKPASELREQNAFLFYKITAIKAGLNRKTVDPVYGRPRGPSNGDTELSSSENGQQRKGRLGWDQGILDFPQQALSSYQIALEEKYLRGT
jgi:hypothetical protein